MQPNNPETKEAFLATLKETAEIAMASGQLASYGVLCALRAAVAVDEELDLLHAIAPFSERQIERLQDRMARIAELKQ